MNELYQIIKLTQENFTNMIHQLSDENERLQKTSYCIRTSLDCMKSSTLCLDVLLSNLIKQTTTIAENTSTNLFDLFQRLNESLSDLVNHGHEYVEQSKQKLSDISRSQAAEQVHMALRRGVEHLSSSFSKAQSTYARDGTGTGYRPIRPIGFIMRTR
ncbi:unnamed protein product [Rotaria sordida]|uniref:Uncharacterized protein n=1 Tax=Rotaria sordida TaxID=392033 RepID=A0A814H945_9BILA|nr:unnamed protein product [Rotaria sordida]